MQDVNNCIAIVENLPYRDGMLHTRGDMEHYKNSYIRSIEGKKVDTHIKLARQAGVPATLTVDEWIFTLEYWMYSCAYCGGYYEVLEHFIPVSSGGGTTADNCVPACSYCNTYKRDKHPNNIIATIHGEEYTRAKRFRERIKVMRSFLATRKGC